VSVQLFPQETGDVADAEARSSCKDSRGDDDAEEIPESADERTALELPGQEAPCKRGCTDEPDEKTDVRREILDCGASQVIEL
jgi:hypothetical protein